MIKPPFTARLGDASAWIVDAQGLSVADINTLLDPEAAFDLAQLFSSGANERLRQIDHARNIAKKAGRPRHKKPSQAALAKRKQRAKTRLKSTQ
jgi:hypothetical protein